MIPVQQPSFTIPAGGSFPLQCNGRYFRIQSATGSLKVVGDSFGNMGTVGVGQGLHLRNEDPQFQRLTFIDTSGLPNLVTVVIADSDFVDNSLLGTVSVIDGEKARTIAGGMLSGSILSPATAGVVSASQLWNPAGSGKNVIITAISVTSPTQNGFYIMSAAAALGADITASSIANKKAGGPLGVALAKNGTAASAPAFASNLLYLINLAALATVSWPIKGAIVLPPNSGLSFYGSLVNTQVVANLEWFEENQ